MGQFAFVRSYPDASFTDVVAPNADTLYEVGWFNISKEAFNVCNLLIAAYNLVENPGKLQPAPLFYTSIGIWSGNALIFTLIYWLIDCGGPDARLSGKTHYPDFVFPAMDDPGACAAGLAAAQR
jgi:Protein of unknown function (DUF1254)